MNKDQDLKSMTKKELQVALQTARVELQKKRITVKTKHETDISSVKKQKKYIARLLTTLKEIEREEKIEELSKVD